MPDRALPSGATSIAGSDYMDAVRDEVEALWGRVADVLTSVAGTNTITANSTVPIAAYADGQSFWLVPANNNTAAVTINIDGKGANNLRDASGNALVANGLVAGRLYKIVRISGAFRIPDEDGGAARIASARSSFENQQTANTAGGTATSGSYLTYPLNTTVLNAITGVSRSGSQITLPAGTYDVLAAVPFYKVGAARLRLRNITDSTTESLLGTTVSAGTADTSTATAVLRGRITIAASKVFELQYRVTTTGTTTGLGLQANFTETEKYGSLDFVQPAA